MDVYDELADHLNNLPSDVAAQENVVGPHLLRELFAPDEARIVLYLTLEPENADVIADRANMACGEARQHLEDMANRGLIVSMCETVDEKPCEADQYLIGLWRFMEDDWRPGHGRVPAYPI